MKRSIVMLAAVFSAAVLVSVDADARRLGGGRSMGAPRETVTQRQAAPQQSAVPAQSAAPASAASAKAPGAAPVSAPQPGWKRWMGPLAGIAAGLGIAALMSHLGLSESFGHFLLIALFVIAAIVVFRMLFRRPSSPSQGQGMQYAGAGMTPGGGQIPAGSSTPVPMFGGAGGATAETEPHQESVIKPFPPGFEPGPFLQQAKLNFARLQAAYDKGDTSTLRDVMTPEMFVEVSKDLAARATQHPTEVVTLDAEVFEVTTENGFHWASVRFTGLLREDGAETAQPFDEAWNLKKPVTGETGWLLAGIQQLN